MIKKSEFIWNTLGSFISAILNSILLAFCTRLNGLEIAGMFAICYATAYIFNSIGDFGLRIVQSSDTNRSNSFSEYLMARIIAIIFMIVSAVVFTLISGYRAEKLIICLLIIAYRGIENISESYQAEFQLNNRLDLGGKTIVYRNTAGIILFLILDILTRNVVLPLIGLVLVNLIIFILYDMRLIKNYTKVELTVDKKRVLNILKECLPLAISTLISMYVINAVKYSIDASGDYVMQTYFNIIYMPTFVINLVSLFIIKPFLKPFGDYWNNKEYKKFIKVICIILGVLVITTICVEIGAYILGIPFLNLLYGVELSMYKKQLLLLIISGLLYACANLIFNALGTMRKQKITTVAYVLTAIIALAFSNRLVQKYSMNGAVYSCLLIMGVLFIFMTLFFVFELYYHIKKEKINDKLEKIK